MSPRHVPATQAELSRIGLLAELPGERLNELAQRLRREQLAPNGSPDADAVWGVVLSGIVSAGGALLRPGDTIPDPSSARAVTPAVVATADAPTYDELLRPLL